MIVLLEKTNRHFSKFLELMKTRADIRTNDLRAMFARSSYYCIILKKVYTLNAWLKTIHPQFYVAEPSFHTTKSKEVFTSLKKCELLEIESLPDFFVLRFKDGPNN